MVLGQRSRAISSSNFKYQEGARSPEVNITLLLINGFSLESDFSKY
jgi:hypothetical protein